MSKPCKLLRLSIAGSEDDLILYEDGTIAAIDTPLLARTERYETTTTAGGPDDAEMEMIRLVPRLIDLIATLELYLSGRKPRPEEFCSVCSQLPSYWGETCKYHGKFLRASRKGGYSLGRRDATAKVALFDKIQAQLADANDVQGEYDERDGKREEIEISLETVE